MPALKKNSTSTKKVSSTKTEADKKNLKKTAVSKKTKTAKPTKVSKAPKVPKTSKTSKTSKAKKTTKTAETLKKPVAKKAKAKAKAPALKKEAKKSKKIIIDVIEDDLDYESKEESSLADFLDSSLPVFDNTAIKGEEVEDLEIDSAADDLQSHEEIDNQKKFFNELKAEFLEKKEAEAKIDYEDEDVKNILELFEDEVLSTKGKGGKNQDIERMKNSRPLFLYTRFVWKFLIIVGLLLVFIFYLLFSKLSIDVIPSTEIISDNKILRIHESESGIKLPSDEKEDIKGVVKNIKVALEEEYQSSGEEFIGEALTARVKLINNYSRGQTLVATTRLLSPDNKLFRLKEAVNIPAGGSVWADVYPEKVSREYAINPTTFSIPGLWVGLQDKIYAKSEEAFVFEQRKERYVRASDIALAEKEIGDKLVADMLVSIEKQKAILEKTEGRDYLYVYESERGMNLVVEAKAEEVKDSFLAKADTEVMVAFFPKDEAVKYGHNSLKVLAPTNKELFEFDSDSVIYRFESYDKESQSVLVRATFVGKMMLKSTEDLIKREELLGLNADQISTYLREKSDIDSFQLKFSPAFVKNAPKLVDRIKVNIINK